ncbi:hypothetical protein E2C01_050105 [Portunus trituberculatus]|uniref:Uncharacterized protein n=1 Tax=Portunus trituberculatus TaxID=210409 RepID=A0A5B7GB68_PORTR|nr:hypothetical protein [Portunus trituberculatus]
MPVEFVSKESRKSLSRTYRTPDVPLSSLFSPRLCFLLSFPSCGGEVKEGTLSLLRPSTISRQALDTKTGHQLPSS